MPYRTQSPDTSESIERMQFEVLRRFGAGKRLQTMRSLSRSQLRWAWSGLRRAHPHLSERELQIKAVELWYGKELAQRLEVALKKRREQEDGA
jgi:hypothetical protein